MTDKQKDDNYWRKDLLKDLKTPLQYKGGYILDADGNEVAGANRNTEAVLTPVHRDELCKELVKRFNEYKEKSMKLTPKELATILAGLRLAQSHREELKGMDHFIDEKPLSDKQIDNLCEKLNIGVK